jgi:phosphoglycerate dehydrogenase-like enzyme
VTQTILIASPIDAELVERIRALDRALHVIHAPELLPRPRYAADHTGAGFTRSPAQAERWQMMLGETDILFDLPTANDLDHAPNVRWIQTTSTGVGQAAARMGLAERGILVTTARGVHARPLAEFTFMALLQHFRGLRHLHGEQFSHRWQRYCGTEVAGRTLVIIGAGDLARGCAKLARAFEMRVIALARDPARARAHNDHFDDIWPISELHRALGMADAVVITVPHTPATEHLIDAAAIAAMRPGIALVNIARGVIIDEDAMIAALRRNHIGFAALDVVASEPLAPTSPLWDLPNVLISPHSASTVTGENTRIMDIFCHNLRCWLDGKLSAMRNILDPALMY